MSDFSGLQRSFALSSMAPPGLPANFSDAPLSAGAVVRTQQLRFRALRGPGEIASVLHLRREIRLPVSALADASFPAREKKETSAAWSARSCTLARP